MNEFVDLSASEGRSSNNSVAARVKALRQNAGKSVEEVVNATQISSMFLHYLENAEYEKVPAMVYSVGMVENMLEFLQVSESEKKSIIEKLEHELLPFEKQKGDHIPYFWNKGKERASKFSKEPKGHFVNDVAKNENKNDFPKEETISDEKSVQHRKVLAQQKKVFSGGYAKPPQKRVVRNFKTKLLPILLIFLSLLVVGLLLFIAYQYNVSRVDKQNSGEMKMLDVEENFSIYTLFDRFDTFELKEGDAVRIFIGSALKQFDVEKISTRDITFSIDNFRSYNLQLRDEVSLDFDDDSIPELTVKFQRVDNETGVVYFESSSFEADRLDYEKIWSVGEKLQVTQNYTLIENSNKTLIRIYVKATTLPVYLSYNVDGKRQNTFSLSPGEDILITAESHIELQVGNYRTAAVVINSFPLQLGLAGNSKYSTTKIIKWLRSPYNETQYDLVIQDYIN